MAAALTDVWVGPLDGSPAGGDGSLLNPYGNLSQALTDPIESPETVCLTTGSICTDITPISTGGAVIESPVTILGSFNGQGAPCEGIATRLASRDEKGLVVRAQDVRVAFTAITQRGSASRAAVVTVENGGELHLAHVGIANLSELTDTTIGIDVDAASVTLVDSVVTSGTGLKKSVGVNAISSDVTVLDSCNTDSLGGGCRMPEDNAADGNPCALATGVDGTNASGVRGIFATGVAVEESAGILARDSEVVVERSSVCADRSGASASARHAIRLEGAIGESRVRGSIVSAGLRGGGELVRPDKLTGLSVATCDGGSILVSNSDVGSFASPVDGTAAEILSGCSATLARNRIVTTIPTHDRIAHGVRCADSTTTCDILENTIAALGENPTDSTIGVLCTDGACRQVAGNAIHAGPTLSGIGVDISGGDALIEANDIVGGCSSEGTGVVAETTGVIVESLPALEYRGRRCRRGLSRRGGAAGRARRLRGRSTPAKQHLSRRSVHRPARARARG